MMFMAGSLNLITIYLGLECLALASYALTGLLRGSARSTEAALKYILIGAISSGVILFGMSLVFGVSGSVHLGDINAAVAAGSSLQPVLLAGVVFLIAGLASKWRPCRFTCGRRTCTTAPLPRWPLFDYGQRGGGICSGDAYFHGWLAGAARALEHGVHRIGRHYDDVRQRHRHRADEHAPHAGVLRRRQAGYIMVGLAVASERAVSAMLYYLIAYAFTTIGAFAVVMLLGKYYPAEEIADFRGLSRRSPLFAFTLAVFMLSLIGLPPTPASSGSSTCSRPLSRKG